VQTVEFNERLTNIFKSLQLDFLLDQLKTVIHGTPINLPNSSVRNGFAGLVFNTKANLQALSTDLQNKEIISALGLEKVFESKPLGEMITAVNSSNDTNAIRSNSHYYHIFAELYIALDNLKRFEETVNKFLIVPKISVDNKEESALEFEIIDVGRGITMDRFEAVLKSIHSLHDTMARALEINGRLAIAFLDSGSNSIVSIKSDGRIIDALRKLVTEVWDRIRFGKYDTLERKLEAAEAGLKFVQFVDEKEKVGALNPATAAQLKHQAVSEVIGLFGNGTSLREIQTQTTLDNRSLLLDKFDVKLIEAGSTAEKTEPQKGTKSVL